MQDLYDNAPCGYHSLNGDGVVVHINQTELGWLGYSRAEVEGKLNFADLLGPADRQKFAEQFAAFKQNGSVHDLEFELIRRDGSKLPVLIYATAIYDAAGKFVISRSSVVDISQHKHMEQRLQRANRALRTLSSCNHALVHTQSEAELLQTICNLIVDQGGYRMAWVGYAENDAERTVRPIARAGDVSNYLQTIHISWSEASEFGQGPTGMAIRSGHTQVNQNFLNNPLLAPWRSLAQRQGYQSSIAIPLKKDARIIGALNIYAVEPDAFDQDEIDLLEELAEDLAFGLSTLQTRNERDQIIAENQRTQAHLQSSLVAAIQAVAATVEARDPYTAGHQRRVAVLAVAIANQMEIDKERLQGIYLAAIVHDVGKVTVPLEILCKPSRLTDIEYQLIQQHVERGYEILKDIPFPWPIASIVQQHHERLDGSGYPQGLRGDAILLEARIVGVADVVESMSSHRPYRASLGIEAALAEIERGRGVHYDAGVVDVCLDLFRNQGFNFPGPDRF